MVGNQEFILIQLEKNFCEFVDGKEYLIEYVKFLGERDEDDMRALLTREMGVYRNEGTELVKINDEVLEEMGL